MVNIAKESIVSTAMFFGYLSNNDIQAAKDWKQAFVDTERHFPHQERALASATTISQMESKIWLVEELHELSLEAKSVCLLGGWFANYITTLLIEKINVEHVHNFEIDDDAKKISYKFNKRYKDNNQYKCDVVNVMFEPVWKKQKKTDKVFDLVINTSCEHMFPMKQFHKLNRGFLDNPVFVLQSTNENKYDDHINCVSGPDELAEQSELIDIMYSGSKVLDSGKERFMVIGR